MEVIKLNKLTFSNFKGFKYLEVDLNGKSLNVSGDNGVGKTTLRDGYLWCLTGIDSVGRTNHEIKPYDKDGNTIHHLESVVQVEGTKDGVPFNFKRLFKERWSRKTGDVSQTYDGDTTEYYIDDKKVSAKEYKEIVGMTYDTNLMSLLSDPTFFVGLKWQDQRDYLFKLISITDQDVENEEEELKGFSTKFKTDMLDSEKKDLRAKRTKAIDGLAENKAKLDENINSLGESTDWSVIEADIAEKKNRIAFIERSINNSVRSSEGVLEKLRNDANNAYVALSKAKTEVSTYETNENERVAKVASSLKLKREQLKVDIEAINIYNTTTLPIEISQLKKQLHSKLEERKEALAEYKEIKASEYSADPICPTCGGVRNNAELFIAEQTELFNQRKSARLEANKTKGLGIKGEIDDINSKLNLKIPKDVLPIETKLAEIVKDESKNVFVKSEAYLKLLSSQAELQKTYDKLSKEYTEALASTEKPDNTKLIEEKGLLVSEIEKLTEQLGAKAEYDRKLSRIAELESEIKKANLAQVELDRSIYLIELFEKTKNKLTEAIINKMFEITTFSLFEYLNDGTPKPNCIPIDYKGVPLSTTNTGSVINMGLDIIRTFSKHFSKNYPIFIDNREGVTKIIDLDNQLINLRVESGVSQLKFELI
mgnify:CR=1 FL=1